MQAAQAADSFRKELRSTEMDTKDKAPVARSEAVYGAATRDEPSAEELEAARLGFRQMLRRKRFSARFIENHAEELLARARFEYSRAVGRGDEIRKPAGWIIHCAWRRTQNQLESEGNEPQLVSTEKAAEIADGSPTPEQALLQRARADAIAKAIEELSVEQRTLIELSYFEGLSVREAGRLLGWHSSKAQRTHESALRKLREALGISDLDELAIEIGLAAWVSLSTSQQVLPGLPGGIEAVADVGQRGAQGLWARGQELARRVALGGGSDAPGAIAAGGSARAAGVCGAAAVACLAGGVVGPGVGGVASIGGEQAQAPPAKVRVAEPRTLERTSGSPAAERGEELAPGKFGVAEGGSDEVSGSKAEPQAPAKPPAARTETEFGAFAGEEAGSNAGAASLPPPESASARADTSSSGPAASDVGKSAAGEFGAFR
jgi:RNA polymerase sigma factor (sigma-70 family)